MRDQEIINLWEAYHSIYSDITESHFKVGDEVICKKSGMEGEVVKVDPEEKGKYYTVKREDGKVVKYAPDELKLEDEDEKKEDENEGMKGAKNGGASKKAETKFHTKLDKLVHKTFGSSPEEKKKMKEEVDIFDVILEHLVAEGYADTNDAALAIMTNMSEEWKQSIVENRGMSHSGGKPGSSGDGSKPKGITGGKTYQMPGWNDNDNKKQVKGA
jgi:hypothetical protein